MTAAALGLLCLTCHAVLIHTTSGAYAYGITPDHDCKGTRP